jgi:hypothetical protein
MKVFLVKIGRKTRRGNFQELCSRAISVSDNSNLNQAYEYFIPRYKGFDVQIDYIAIEELSEVIPKASPALSSIEQGCIRNFKVTYTDTEKQLYKEYKELSNKADKVLHDLHESITNRYEKLFYVSTYRTYIELDTDLRYGEGTFCKKLPIKSNDFFKAIKDCNDGMEELQIIANNGNGDDPGVPF